MNRGSREGTEPRCPFCGSALGRPAEMAVGPGETGQGGNCECGAIYLVDPTGKNVGEVMAQALGMVADRLSRNVWDLTPGGDYDDAIMSYDVRTHRSAGLDRGYMDGYGRLYIIKVKRKSG